MKISLGCEKSNPVIIMIVKQNGIVSGIDPDLVIFFDIESECKKIVGFVCYRDVMYYVTLGFLDANEVNYDKERNEVYYPKEEEVEVERVTDEFSNDEDFFDIQVVKPSRKRHVGNDELARVGYLHQGANTYDKVVKDEPSQERSIANHHKS
ncbi:unnamed protein product [Dovyalis caffra]|uniref:Uncharacterized protein n=1 Tax=Dovyalis caffra TaxID=77055 RepID=A0AAV1R4S6_9ROSI|nr:unnamed protein product [Dovyalis caffra]